MLVSASFGSERLTGKLERDSTGWPRVPGLAPRHERCVPVIVIDLVGVGARVRPTTEGPESGPMTKGAWDDRRTSLPDHLQRWRLGDAPSSNSRRRRRGSGRRVGGTQDMRPDLCPPKEGERWVALRALHRRGKVGLLLHPRGRGAEPDRPAEQLNRPARSSFREGYSALSRLGNRGEAGRLPDADRQSGRLRG
jgi:hypothetical protein